MHVSKQLLKILESKSLETLTRESHRLAFGMSCYRSLFGGGGGGCVDTQKAGKHSQRPDLELGNIRQYIEEHKHFSTMKSAMAHS